MALSKSLPTGQIALGCQVCETSNKIQWRCETCKHLLCDLCKTTVHAKIGQNHHVINIRNIGKPSDSVSKHIEFTVLNQYAEDIRHIHFLTVCVDGSLWIGDNKTKTIQHIKIEHDTVKTLSTYKTRVYGLATSPSGSTYIVRQGSSVLGIINPMTGQIIDSKLDVQPWIINCVHVTRDHSVIIGAWDEEDSGIVIVMNTEGTQIKKYEQDNQQQIFKLPETITTTSQGIVVGDRFGNKVVVLHPEDNIGYYHGHPDINSPDEPIIPAGLLTTPSDNILVADFSTDYLHILNNEGEIITYYNPKDIGILRPYSIALTPCDNIYLGCASAVDDSEETKAKLYELTFSGF